MECNRAAYEGIPDKKVMAAFKEGDVGAYIELYHRFEERISGFLQRFQNKLTGAVTVDDIVQHTFINLYTRGHLYNEQEDNKFNTWLFTIAANLARTEVSKLKRRNTHSLNEFKESSRHDFSVDDILYGGDVTKELELGESVGFVMRGLERLFDEHEVFCTVLLLRGVQGLKYQTIADIMHIPVGTVKSRINRGREYLRNGYY